MYCKSCGNEVSIEDSFCVRCGNKVDSKNIYENINTNIKKEYKLSKVKQLGAVNISVIETNININNNKMNIIEQRKVLGLFKGKRKANSLIITDIKGITTKTTIDTIDLIYAIVFALIGIALPPAFIISAVCLFTGYGQRIFIKDKNGNEVKIQAEKSPIVQEFIHEVNTYINI